MTKSYSPYLMGLRGYLDGMNTHQIGLFRQILNERLPGFLESIAADVQATYPGDSPKGEPPGINSKEKMDNGKSSATL